MTTKPIIPSREIQALANKLHDAIIDAFVVLGQIRHLAPEDNVVGGMNIVMLEALDYANEICKRSKDKDNDNETDNVAN